MENSEKFEKYEDNAFDQISNIDGLLCLFDGMSGDYIYIGMCIKKSGNNERLDNIEIPELESSVIEEVKERLSTEFGIKENMAFHLVTHYR